MVWYPTRHGAAQVAKLDALNGKLGTFDPFQTEHRSLLMSILVHACDISHPARILPQSAHAYQSSVRAYFGMYGVRWGAYVRAAMGRNRIGSGVQL
jgi:hypothetical protein